MVFLSTVLRCFDLRRMRGLLLFGWLACTLQVTTPTASAAEPPTTREYSVKAAFLFNFAQFVEWPESAFGGPDAPFIIGILGEDPFGSYLDNLVRGEKIRGRPIAIRRYRNVEEAANSHILFISLSGSDRVESTLAALKNHSVLTVADLDNFARLGGIIRFVTENGKIRLRINLTAARESHLTISSKLLRAATAVETPKD